MAATPVTEDPQFAAIERLETLCDYMPKIALAVNGFADPGLRESAFAELVGILNPSPDSADLIAVPQWGDAPASAVELGRLATWVADKAPMVWRDSVAPEEHTVDAAIRFLGQGAEAWTQTLLVKHALMTAGGFTAEQVDGDLATLVREMAADPPVSSPEIEQLAAHLRAEAKPGETATQVALRLIERLRQGRPVLPASAVVGEGSAQTFDASRPVDLGEAPVDQGLRREPGKVDDREQQ